MKESVSRELKIAKSGMFLIIDEEPEQIRVNGWRRWIQRIEQDQLPSRRRVWLQMKGVVDGDLKIAIFGTFFITVRGRIEIWTNGWYHQIQGIKQVQK